MAESSVCLVRSFSQPSPTSSEEKKGNPLTTSVSFGRFMSESLDWGKWSAFTHNRYLEEVEKYSKPGSVAEKKAYFEAHYKRRRAAALLEQQNASANDFSQTNVTNKVEDNSSSVSDMATENMEEGEVQNCDIVFSAGDQNGICDDAIVERKLGDGEREQVTEVSDLMEIPLESKNNIVNDGYVSDILSNQENKEDSNTMRNSALEKPKLSLSKLKSKSALKKLPLGNKPIMPLQIRNSENTTPDGKKNAKELSNKRKSNSTSLHMSINFGETRKATSPGLPKLTNSRLIRTTTPVEKSKTGTLPQTSTKVQSLCTNFNKTSNTCGGKARSPSVSSSFIFKSEERVAKRKEFFQKLEQKKSKESDKLPIHAKQEFKARSDLKDQLKATKNAKIPLTIKSPSNLTKKMPTVPQSPKIQEREALKVQDNDSRPPWRFSMKAIDSSKDVKGKNISRPPIYFAKSSSKKIMSENASPNIKI
ncbi:hypothetical protein ACJIZ3_010377 [Penstemon smallii]|uniref:TPX2 C-terminal domain-containing protein n=1 Tax=Penstemon smallii TaxID=265156 RepID=A0ABD3TF60_9LAMI